MSSSVALPPWGIEAPCAPLGFALHARNEASPGGARVISDPDVVGLLYLVAIVCFIVSLRFSPR